MPEVCVVERGVMSALRPKGEQAIVIPFLDDPAFFHDDDPVRGFDGGQPMPHQRRPAKLPQRAQDE